MRFGQIISIKDGKPVYSYGISNGANIKEILLQKQPIDTKCNICLNDGELTDDHVPPKCTGNRGRYHYVSFFNYTFDPNPTDYGICQNGIKYKTVCAKCNNEKLQFYDNAIAELYNNFNNVEVSNKLIVRLKIRPNGIMRGIMGHLLAAKSTHNRSKIDDLFFEAVNEPNKRISKQLNFYVLPYLYRQIRIIRDQMILVNNKFILLSILKIKPFAFVITHSEPFFNAMSWNKFFDYSPNEESEIEFFNKTACPLDFPENIRPQLFGQSGAESIIGFPVKK